MTPPPPHSCYYEQGQESVGAHLKRRQEEHEADHVARMRGWEQEVSTDRPYSLMTTGRWIKID
jgi:hypothetical protein